MEPGEPLHENIEKLDSVIQDAVTIITSTEGKQHTGRQNRALTVYSKLICHLLSMRTILGEWGRPETTDGLLDHYSVAILGRAVIDSALMTMYLSEFNISLSMWNLRRHILYLHDATNRKRFLTPLESRFPQKSPLEEYKESKRVLSNKIDEYARELKYNHKKIEELKRGLVYIDGARGAAREAGWNIELFDFHQSYFSAYVHSHPVSYLRFNQHDIGFEKPSDAQLAIANLVVQASYSYAESVNARMSQAVGDIARDPLGHID